LTPVSEEKFVELTVDLEKPNQKLPLDLEWNIVEAPIQQQWEAQEAFLNKDLLKNPLTLRKYKKGDYFCPTGMKGKKLLSKFFKDEKYSLIEKEKQWLFCSQDQIVWVVGRRCDRRFIATAQTQNKLLMRTKK
jgi:tRNA(Ile)-lysidine synthase